MKINTKTYQLIKEAMHLSGADTEQKVVDLSLDRFVKILRRKNMLSLFGTVKWEGNLIDMRND